MTNETKYTKEDLKAMQAWDFERKIRVTQTRIIEWYKHYDGKVYVSFSGGKDSTVLLDLARRIYPDIEAVFVDTGLEYPEIRDFVKSKDNVTWLKPEMSFRKVIETYGYPIGSKRTALNIEYGKKARERGDIEQYEKYIEGKRNGKKDGKLYYYGAVAKRFLPLISNDEIKISSKCCAVMKEKPLNTYSEQRGKKPIVGIMASESKRRELAWIRTGCNAFDTANPISKPMSFWTEQDVLRYLKEFNIPYASVYGDILQDENGKYYTTGCDRTGCIFCGFGCHLEKEPNRFQRLKKTHPKLWEYCMKPWDEGGLGMRKVLDYIGVKSGKEDEGK